MSRPYAFPAGPTFRAERITSIPPLVFVQVAAYGAEVVLLLAAAADVLGAAAGPFRVALPHRLFDRLLVLHG
ncbi:MAG: hypothetical protein HYS09_00890 [Chloroflexi bacterium]|nr:hypothetical protein [Chloroflexota bacterium]